MRMRQLFMSVTIFGIFLFMLSEGMAQASVARLHGFRGEIKIISQQMSREPYLKMELFNNDEVISKNGHAEILFTDGSLVKLRPYSELKIALRPLSTKMTYSSPGPSGSSAFRGPLTTCV